MRRRRQALAFGLACSLAAEAADAQTIPAEDLRAPQFERVRSVEAREPCPQELYLEVLHGDRPVGRLVRVCLRKGRLSADAEDLRAAGIVLPLGLPRDRGGLVPLDAVPGLAHRYEPRTQRLILRAPPALRPVQHVGYGCRDHLSCVGTQAGS